MHWPTMSTNPHNIATFLTKQFMADFYVRIKKKEYET